MNVKPLIAFIRLSRLHFLVGGLLMFALGAVTSRPITVFNYVSAQIMVTAAQITAHYVNEYADYEADKQIANRTSFSGGSGVLVSGELPLAVALRAGIASSVVALSAALVVNSYSQTAALLGIVALVVSWAYSMPPARLLDTGCGELVTAITVAAFVPLVGATSQHSVVPTELWHMIFVLVPVQLAMLLAFELPDLETDAIAGKRVLAVRIGRSRAITLMTALVIIAVAIGVLASLPGAALGLPTLIVMLVAARRSAYAVLTFSAVASFALCGVGLLLQAL